MKRIRILLLSTAIVAAVCSAFATKMDVVCEDCPQYYLSGSNYYPAGVFGVNYDCDYWTNAVTCTYYRPDPAQPNYYAPCRFGDYIYLGIKNDKNQAVKK
jgi:hypothetical protein